MADWRDHPIWRPLIIARSLLTIGLLVWLAVLGGSFEGETLGFLSGPGGTYCHDLMSSGSNDDSFPGVLFLMLIPAVIRLLLLRSTVRFWERTIYFALLLSYLLLQTMDCADLRATVASGDLATIRLLKVMGATSLIYLLPNFPPPTWATFRARLQPFFW